MTTAFLFPGQGAQAVGMGRALVEAVPAARAVLDEVDAALGLPLSRLILEGPADQLTLTENAQPALMAVSLAGVRALEAAAGRPLAALGSHVAGHSLGEYSALAAAGALTIADAARLLRLRGRAMQEAVPVGRGAMAAILGLELEAVEAVARAATAGDEICTVANDNAPGQVVVSGHAGAVERALRLAREQGARRSVLLQVSAPFHCPLMAPAAAVLAEALALTDFRPPSLTLVANVTAAPLADPAEIPGLLERQVTARVRWRESLETLAGLGVERLVEIGAGRILTGLAKRTVPGVEALALQTPDEIEAFVRAAESG